MLRLALALLACAAPTSLEPEHYAQLLARYPAPESSQGVAVDAASVYAVGDSAIGKYDKQTGARVGGWSGDARRFPHLNSCAVLESELVCASSNYPATPMKSTVEVFDPAAMRHLRSIRLGRQPGSLTWVDRRGGAWWAGFANYDGIGGERGRDHRFTTLVKFDDRWRTLAAWTFPDSVLDSFKPRSSSGGAWGEDGLLYVTGHDAPEVYVLRLPASGSVLEHVATIAVPTEGQAIAFDRTATRVLFGISRARGEMVAMRLPAVGE